MQTAALFVRGRELGVALAAVLIVTESAAGEQLDDERARGGRERGRGSGRLAA